MIQAIQKVLDKVNATYSTTFTLDASLACPACKVRFHQTQQEDWKTVIDKICEYTGHIWLLEGTVVKVIDKLGGQTPPIVITDFTILEDGLSSQSDDSIVNTYRADWNTEVFDNRARTLTPSNKTASALTGLTSGVEVDLQPLDYVRADIKFVLDRKRQLHMLDSVSIRLGLPENIPIGQIVELSSDYAEGSFIVTNKRFTADSTEEISGVGSISYKEFT